MEFALRRARPRRRTTRVEFASAPDGAEVDEAGTVTVTFRLHLGPYQTRMLGLTVDTIADDAEPDPIEFDVAVHDLRRSYEDWERDSTQVVTDNELFDQLLARCIRPTCAPCPHGRPTDTMLAAGIPWYVTLFGRDALIASHQLLSVNPDLARDTLELLARLPGHEGGRRGATRSPARSCTSSVTASCAGAGEIPHTPYYGSVDATPLFLIALRRATSAGRATSRSSASCCPTPRPRCAGSTTTATATATASSSTRRARPAGSATRAGRTRTTRSCTPTAASPSRRSRWSRCRATCTSRSSAWPTCSRRSATTATRGVPARAGRTSCGAGSTRRSGWRTSSSSRSRSTATSGRCARVTSNPGHGLYCGILDDDKARARRQAAARARHVQRLGYPHAEQVGGRLQPDELPQRLGLAARQRADRRRAEALRVRPTRRNRVATALFDAAIARRLHAAARALLRVHAPVAEPARSATPWRAARRPGRPARRS